MSLVIRYAVTVSLHILRNFPFRLTDELIGSKKTEF